MERQPRIPDYYAILGVHHKASRVEIRRSYRKLSRKWRDSNIGGVGFGARFVAKAAIDESYNILKDAEKKAEYDSGYSSIRKAWMKYAIQQAVAARENHDDVGPHSSDEDSEIEDELGSGEDCDGEDDTDDGGPDGEATDEEWSDSELLNGEKAVVRHSKIEQSESEEESEAEFTDDEEPFSDDAEEDESVDAYADYCKGYASDSESSDEEASYAIRLRSGKWVRSGQHDLDDPEHATCDLEDMDDLEEY